ncbi:alpha/beta fold hydrolase [Patescibacteria group bacterium]|nr:alpha/beta fold hydrolase [Patescibacteria group bacterium]
MIINKKLLSLTVFCLIVLVAYGLYRKNVLTTLSAGPDASGSASLQTTADLNPLTIAAMRQRSYQGSTIKIEETLSPGSNYNRYIASYISDGLKIYGLLTVPDGQKPKGGWPAIIFNHGYIPPEQYRTTERYVAYVDEFARNGYVVFKPDYRGNGSSEGKPEGAYYSPAYTVDVLNALSSVKKYSGVDPNRIGMWGHSMGGNITLRAMVVSKDIKVGVIWGGVVGTYDQLMNHWHRTTPWAPSEKEIAAHVTSIRQNLAVKYGSLQQNPDFWHSIDPRYYLSDISGPLQLDQGLADEEVPPEFSQSLYDDLKKIGKTVELYTYPGADHNISDPSFTIAMQHSLDFFDKYLKGGDTVK